MRLLTALVLTVSLGAAAQTRGVEGTASTTRDTGFIVTGGDPLGMNFEEGIGRARLSVVDRVTSGAATHGDRAELSAELRLPGARYRIELDASRRTQIGGAPAGGVAFNVLAHGGGIGLPMAVRAHAAFVLTGVGSVYLDDRLLTDKAVIYGFALAQGTHSDDRSHQLLNQAREGDAEIEILVTNLPGEAVPGGMLRVFYDDVNISVAGASIPTVATATDNVPQANPTQVTSPINYGTTLLPQAGEQTAAQQTLPINVDNRLDITGGQIVGFRRFENGVQVAAGGVDARRSPNDADAQTGVNTDGAGASQTGISSTAGTESFATAPQSTGVDDSIRVANSNPAAPLPPTPRPLNAYAAPTLPAGISPLSANPLVPLPPTVRPANSDPVAPLTQVQPLNPNAPAIGTTVEQFPGLTPSSTTGSLAQGTSNVGLPYSSGFGITATTAPTDTGTGGSGTNATGTSVTLSPGAAETANNTVPGTGVSSTFLTLPGSGVNPANIPGTSTGGFAGQPVVGGSGTFPGLTPSGTTPALPPPGSAQ